MRGCATGQRSGCLTGCPDAQPREEHNMFCVTNLNSSSLETARKTYICTLVADVTPQDITILPTKICSGIFHLKTFRNWSRRIASVCYSAKFNIVGVVREQPVIPRGTLSNYSWLAQLEFSCDKAVGATAAGAVMATALIKYESRYAQRSYDL